MKSAALEAIGAPTISVLSNPPNESSTAKSASTPPFFNLACYSSYEDTISGDNDAPYAPAFDLSGNGFSAYAVEDDTQAPLPEEGRKQRTNFSFITFDSLVVISGESETEYTQPTAPTRSRIPPTPGTRSMRTAHTPRY